MNNQKAWDIIVIGGGVAGLSFSILSAKSGLSVLVIEKGQYPKHKVCGEYISMESYNFLEQLGLPLSEMALPRINNFVLTSHYGLSASCNLEKGGIGISRYMLDDMLAKIAMENGVTILTGHKVKEVGFNNNQYTIQTQGGEIEKAKLLVGAYGRISGLDEFKNKEPEKYIGVKYHLNEGPPGDTIEIHNFKGGYCGISKIEEEKYNLCYLAKAADLKPFKGNLEAYENAVLKKNDFLKKRLKAKRLTETIATARINFGVSNSHQKVYLQIGDAAGFIPPITGNGMSLAFRSAKILHGQVLEFFTMKKGKDFLLKENQKYISQYLTFRIKKGVFLQNLLFIENRGFNKLLMKSLIGIPGLMKLMTKQATGKTI